MAESQYAKMRSKVRIKTDLKAHCFIQNEESQPFECTIIDLSVSGAGVVFQHNGKMSIGDTVGINIFLPNTILHVSVRAEIRWKRRRAKDFICGVQFQELLSERMFQQLIKQNT
jgi:c-di-GMP-binding flagellar brake protein YcgR